MKKNDEIYLQIFSLDENSLCLAPIETVICLFVVKYCESDVSVRLVSRKVESAASDNRGYTVDISDIAHRLVRHDEMPYNADACDLPNIIIVSGDDVVTIAGLCASLRQIVKRAAANLEHQYRKLLGFKDSCLMAPAETSVWTKYCEVDLPLTLKKLTGNGLLSGKELPATMARFEAHMNEPVRLHNVYKYTMSKRFASKDNGNGIAKIPEHLYAEGSYLTLADLIILVCIHILFGSTCRRNIDELLPLTNRWYNRVLQDPSIGKCLDRIVLQSSHEILEIPYVLPAIEKLSLYKSNPKRYKPRNRVYTRQEDVENSLRLVNESSITRGLDIEPYGADVTIDWEKIPLDARPEGGALPITRLKRKYEQLENLCRPVLRLAKKDDVIVDFCSGSGHLGILVAYLLPQCVVILLENKEESLNRSRERVKKLGLCNIKFFQSNLDYFRGKFDIGLSLHACGVATDLVIQHCIRRGAIFVSCPCCYGSVQDCHRITYPRSKLFRKSLGKRDYLVLSHSSDQTHDEKNAKTVQGNECMAIIDTDRKLQAEEHGYRVYLAKLIPETCTPKNHLLVGIPKEKA